MRRVDIRRVADGCVVSMMVPGDEDEGTFIWEHGDYSCDCNRELFFMRALGKGDEIGLDDVRCSEGRFQVRLFDGDTIAYDEFPKEAQP